MCIAMSICSGVNSLGEWSTIHDPRSSAKNGELVGDLPDPRSQPDPIRAPGPRASAYDPGHSYRWRATGSYVPVTRPEARG